MLKDASANASASRASRLLVTKSCQGGTSTKVHHASVHWMSLGARVAWSLTLLVVIGALFGWDDETADDAECRRLVMDAWKRYEEQASKNWSRQASKCCLWMDGKCVLHLQLTSRRASKCLCMEEQYLGAPSGATYGRVRCINPDYAFVLWRPNDRRAWALVAVHPVNTGGYETILSQQAVQDSYVGGQLLSIPFSGYLPKLLNLPGRVIRCRSDKASRDRVILIIKNLSQSLATTQEERVSQVIVRVNPRCYYVPEYIQWVSGNPNDPGSQLSAKCETVVRYRLNERNFPVPIAHEGSGEEYVRNQAGDIVAKRLVKFVIEHEVDEYSPLASENEFRLSYYGLPEPQGLSWPKPTPWWLYMILSGLALVAIGLAIYAYRRWRLQRTFAA